MRISDAFVPEPGVLLFYAYVGPVEPGKIVRAYAVVKDGYDGPREADDVFAIEATALALSLKNPPRAGVETAWFTEEAEALAFLESPTQPPAPTPKRRLRERVDGNHDLRVERALEPEPAEAGEALPLW